MDSARQSFPHPEHCPVSLILRLKDEGRTVQGAALDLTRSKSELLLELALLRQQLTILQRQTKRPKLAWRDRALPCTVSTGH